MNYSLLISKLESLGGRLNAPATQDAISLAEQRLDAKFPACFREYLLAANGLDSHLDDCAWEFFPLDQIDHLIVRRSPEHFVALSDPYREFGPRLVMFSDALVDAPTYAICCDLSRREYGNVFCDAGFDAWHVSDSFEGFIQLFLKGHQDALLG
jgi:hypothetical protein